MRVANCSQTRQRIPGCAPGSASASVRSRINYSYLAACQGLFTPKNLSSRRFLGTFSLREGSGERSNQTKGSYSSFEMFNLLSDSHTYISRWSRGQKSLIHFTEPTRVFNPVRPPIETDEGVFVRIGIPVGGADNNSRGFQFGFSCAKTRLIGKLTGTPFKCGAVWFNFLSHEALPSDSV